MTENRKARNGIAKALCGLAASFILSLSIAQPAQAYTQQEQIINGGHGYISPSYLCIHETANPGASAWNHVKLWSRGYSYACHYVMEIDGSTVYHTMADNRKSWSVGRGNPYVVSIELAHATNAQDFYNQYSQAAQWAAHYLKTRGWGIERMISHDGARRIWGGTDHTDPIGYFSAYGRSWADFKALVQRYMNGGSYQPSKVVNVPQNVQNGTSTAKKNTGFGGVYRCNADVLNIRTAPNGTVVGSYRRGQTVELDDWYTTVNGYVWGRYTSFGGRVRYIAVGKATGKVDASDYLIKTTGGTPKTAYTKAPAQAAGRYTFKHDMRIRSGAGTGYRAVGTYRRGQSVYIDSTVTAGGTVWGRYKSFSGYTRYVALRTTGGKVYAVQ